jgi:uncharacterized protein (TIGR02145 family)
MKNSLLFILLFLPAISANSTENNSPQKNPVVNFPAIKIGNQTWMTRNWNYPAPKSWYFDNDSIQNKKFGRLYFYSNAIAASPPGWHLPTLQEWNTLIQNLGGDSLAVLKLFDSTGMNLLYGGNKSANISPTDIFNFKDHWGFYWTSTPDEEQTAYAIHFTKGSYKIERLSYRRANGFSVRYMKND